MAHFDEDFARILRAQGIDPEADPRLIREQLQAIKAKVRAQIDDQLEVVRTYLRKSGIHVVVLSELSADMETLRRAVPLLVQVFPKVTIGGARNAILDVLSAKGGFPHEMIALLRQLRPAIEEEQKSERESEFRRSTQFGWQIGSAIEQTARIAPVFEELVELIHDRRYGIARQMLALALVKVKAKRAEATKVLIEVIDQPEMTAYVAMALAKAGAHDAIETLRNYQNSSDSLTRSEVRKAIRKLERLSMPVSRAESAESNVTSAPTKSFRLAEVSQNFDREQLQEFLRYLPTQIDGLSASAMERVVKEVDDMDVDEERTFQLQVRANETKAATLTLTVFTDDLDAPDATFVADDRIIDVVRAAMQR